MVACPVLSAAGVAHRRHAQLHGGWQIKALKLLYGRGKRD
jgi:hypothetical protein